jgi:hypothetical protein
MSNGQPNRELMQKLLDASNQINKASRRGGANYMLVNSSLSRYLSLIMSLDRSRRIKKIEKILKNI